ncbi:MAG: hypothetical protein HYX39_04870 [Bacteroidetes bacterium]|nr:hypothetical protein [Bacteroidota bacterium]
MKTTYFILSLLTLGLFFNACKKDTICNDPANPRCKNYDACHGRAAVSADFKIYENVGSIGMLVEADTIWFNSTLMLWVQNHKNDYKELSINWRVKSSLGFNQTYSDTLVKFNYWNMLPAASFYTVTCTITKNIGACTNLKSVDSLSKIFYIWPKQFPNDDYVINGINTYKYLPIYGTYKGYKNSNPSQQVYVTLFDTVIQPQYFKPCESGVPIQTKTQCNLIRNLAYNNYSTENTSLANGNNFYAKGASGIVLGDGYTCAVFNPPCYSSKYFIGYNGIAWTDLYNSKKVYINYSFPDTLTNTLVKDFFTGYKIN